MTRHASNQVQRLTESQRANRREYLRERDERGYEVLEAAGGDPWSMNYRTGYLCRQAVGETVKAMHDWDVSIGARLLAIVLAAHTNRKRGGNICWPGLRALTEWMGVTRPTVIRAVAELEAAELIEVDRSRAHRRSNRYICLWLRSTSRRDGKNLY